MWKRNPNFWQKAWDRDAKPWKSMHICQLYQVTLNALCLINTSTENGSLFLILPLICLSLAAGSFCLFQTSNPVLVQIYGANASGPKTVELCKQTCLHWVQYCKPLPISILLIHLCCPLTEKYKKKSAWIQLHCNHIFKTAACTIIRRQTHMTEDQLTLFLDVCQKVLWIQMAVVATLTGKPTGSWAAVHLS